MLACSVGDYCVERVEDPDVGERADEFHGFGLCVSVAWHVVHDDSRRFVIKRSELRAWTERDQLRVEYSESLMVECGTVIMFWQACRLEVLRELSL